MRGFITFFIFFYLLIFVQSVFAFQMTSLSLRVVDQKGALVPNVTVGLKLGNKIINKITTEEAKEIVFSKLQLGKYILDVEANGFTSLSQEIEIKSGKNDLVVNLEIGGIVESVKIERDVQEKSIDDSFSGFFSRVQIDALPDDPKEIEKELKRLYGEDTIIRVDGFTGRMPNKSQISSIKASLSSFDAENHELGFTYVDVITKVGKESFSGNVGLRFNDESLNARNPFSPNRLPEQIRDIDFFLVGPLKQNQSFFWIGLSHHRNLKRENIIAILPGGAVKNSINSQTKSTYFSSNINQNLIKQHVARIYYGFSNKNSENLGVGGFNLSERAFSNYFREHQVQVSESGYIGNRFLNTFQLEFTRESSKTTSQNDDTAIIVLDAFSKGGAGNASQNVRQNLWFADNLLWGYKKHALKIGGLVWFEQREEISKLNQNGTFVFSSLDDFQANKPSLFTQDKVIRKSKVSQIQVGVYVQDDFRIRKNLGLSFGLRYEWQNNVQDYNNFSPRFGFTWSPSKSGKITFRGGIGVFYNWLETETLSFIANQSIDQSSETIIINPNFSNPFQNGKSQILSKSYWKKADDLKNPYVIHSSIGVESPLRKNLSIRANYIYQKGVHQFRSRNINAPISGIRPNIDFGNIIQVESSAFFVKNSLTLGLNGGITKHIAFGFNYTLAKRTSDNNGVFGLPSDNFNLKSDVSVANDDQRHRLYASLGWTIKKGLRLAAIYTANSSLPYTITTGKDENSDTNFNDRPFGSLRNSERGKWRNQLDIGFSWFFSFINRKKENTGTTSVTMSNDEINPGFDKTDSKKRFSAKFHIATRNVLNQTNFNSFVGVQTSPFFRQPISADNPRRIDLGLRFNF